MRLRDIVDRARLKLEAAGVPRAEAALDAELLARDVLGWDRATWLARRDDEHLDAERMGAVVAGESFEASFDALVARRARREPVAYIRRTQEFYGRAFRVGPGVLIPRPETELVVGESLAVAATRPIARIADIGTGSGCIGVTLALELPAVRVVATDVSARALAIARANASGHGVSERVRFVETCELAGVAAGFDLIASNPAYVRERDVQDLAPEVRDYEPLEALSGGVDGLRNIRRVLAAAAAALAADGVLVMEIGIGQRDDVVAEVAAAGLTTIAVRHDLQDIPRVVVAARSP